jgi:hypothetical protein
MIAVEGQSVASQPQVKQPSTTIATALQQVALVPQVILHTIIIVMVLLREEPMVEDKIDVGMV